MEEKKIGDIFKIGDSQFICNESLDGSCDECAFADMLHCSDFIIKAGHCSAKFRTDKTDVIFKRI